MTPQGIKQRLHFDADDTGITFAIRPLKIVNRLFVFMQGHVYKRKGERRDASMRAQPLELREKLSRFVALVSLCISLCQHRHHNRIVRYLNRFFVFGHRFGQLSL
jgi:hypothetical protein